jgi:multicomponent Na+:H+ antiporter subunit E
MMKYFRVVVPAFLIYIGLTANFELSNLVVGALMAVMVGILVRPKRRAFHLRYLPGALVSLVKYIVLLLYDLIMSGVQVAQIVLNPKLPINPGIITIPVRCETELANALSAHAITLTPGELVIEMDEHGVMYTHILDMSREREYIDQAQSQRRDLLRRIFI